MKYLDEPFIEFIYKNYDSSELSDAVFSVGKFINTKNGKDAVVKSEYKDYTLVNSIAITQQIH